MYAKSVASALPDPVLSSNGVSTCACALVPAGTKFSAPVTLPEDKIRLAGGVGSTVVKSAIFLCTNKLNPDCPDANLSFNGFIISVKISSANATMLAIFVRCVCCAAVFGLATESGFDFMTAIPFQLLPTTFATDPEKPPKIPLLI